MRTGASLRRRGPASWPFWALLAAWCCANSPQEFTCAVMLWTRGARHFSHEARLKEDVARLLSGQPVRVVFRSLPSLPRAPFRTPVAAETGVKRFEYCAPVGRESFPVPGVAYFHRIQVAEAAEHPRPEPLLAPPKGTRES